MVADNRAFHSAQQLNVQQQHPAVGPKQQSAYLTGQKNAPGVGGNKVQGTGVIGGGPRQRSLKQPGNAAH